MPFTTLFGAPWYRRTWDRDKLRFANVVGPVQYSRCPQVHDRDGGPRHARIHLGLCPMPGVSGVAPDIYRDSLCGPITFLCTPYGVPRSVTHDSVLDAIEAGALNRMPGTALLRACVSLATKKRKRANDGAALSVIAAPCLRPDIDVKRAFAAISEDWWRWGDEMNICRVGPFFVAPIIIDRRLLAVHCASLQPAGGARDVQWARGLCTEGLCRAIPNTGGSDPCHLRSVTPTCAAMVVGQGRGKPLKVTLVVWWTPAAGLRVKVQRKAKRCSGAWRGAFRPGTPIPRKRYCVNGAEAKLCERVLLCTLPPLPQRRLCLCHLAHPVCAVPVARARACGGSYLPDPVARRAPLPGPNGDMLAIYDPFWSQPRLWEVLLSPMDCVSARRCLQNRGPGEPCPYLGSSSVRPVVPRSYRTWSRAFGGSDLPTGPHADRVALAYPISLDVPRPAGPGPGSGLPDWTWFPPFRAPDVLVQ